MTYRVEFLGVAELELEDAVEWYASQKNNSNAIFLEAIDTLFSYIVENPYLFPTVYNELRKANLRNFPYSIIYETHEPDVILVVAVVHQKRNPNRWLNR